jgi:hypothetical protein
MNPIPPCAIPTNDIELRVAQVSLDYLEQLHQMHEDWLRHPDAMYANKQVGGQLLCAVPSALDVLPRGYIWFRVPMYQVVPLQELLRKEGLERLQRLPDSNMQQYPTGFAGSELGQLLQVQTIDTMPRSLLRTMDVAVVRPLGCSRMLAHVSQRMQAQCLSCAPPDTSMSCRWTR